MSMAMLNFFIGSLAQASDGNIKQQGFAGQWMIGGSSNHQLVVPQWCRFEVRMVDARYGFFTPDVEVSAGTPLVFRFGTPDVIRGLHVPGSNVDTAVSPGFVSEVRTGLEGSASNKAAARRVGEVIAERARAAGFETVVFDRGTYRYHGKVKELADAARAKGLKF